MLRCSSGCVDTKADKKSGQETMPGGASHRLLLVYAPPAPHRGVDNARPVHFRSDDVLFHRIGHGVGEKHLVHSMLEML